MSCSKPLPPFTFDVLCYLNRDQLERFSIVCRLLKNLIDRYFRSKPFRVFDELRIHEGSYALRHNYVQWHPNRGDYSAQQFLDGHECSKNKNWGCSFAEIRPYLGPTVRIKQTTMYVGYTYNFDQIAEMESIAYLWRDGDIVIQHHNILGLPIVAEDFQPILSFSYFAIVHYIRYYISPKTILNSPTILQCRKLIMNNAHFSFKDYKVLYAVKVIEVHYYNYPIDPDSWLQFLDQPGVKPIVVLRQSRREVADNVLNSIAYLWRDGDIYIRNYYSKYNTSIVAEDFLPILNSPTILQCKKLFMDNAHFSFKYYKILYSLKVIEVHYYNYPIDPDSWLQFLDQPGVKPIVVLRQSRREVADNVLNRFVKNFSSAVSPNAFKIVFAELDDPVTEFRETNNISGEVLELKKGVPAEYCKAYHYNFMLERSSL